MMGGRITVMLEDDTWRILGKNPTVTSAEVAQWTRAGRTS
jgi:hypothetical protein